MTQKRTKITKEDSSYHHGELKKALVIAARKILKKQGLDALSLRSLARELGVSQMAPYAHFKDKQALVQAIASSGYEELAIRMIEAQKQNANAKGRGLAYIYGVEYILYAIENPDLYRLMLSQINPIKQSTQKQKNREVWNISQRPFLLLFSAFANDKMNKETAYAKALGSWSIVHGIATLAIDGHLDLPEGMDIIQLFQMTIES
ncbi:WHG domain protein [Leptospira ryugenii]|uniref:WHG domain protein n=1 Tax=Leptospira ryugenii TaxID=1917863 RepID=A0A2P2E1Z7_9LEPT|nr:TetR/AcrR family transcriptional regulator [Leptospira ryugenii]GBF50925.1 WHG domain protein [Leptospira ryugenii]